MTERQIVCIFLPRFAMERWQRTHGNARQDDAPFVLVQPGPHGPVIYATNQAAEQSGITVGARLTDMRAVCPELNAADAHVHEDIKALESLAIWAQRWCPWTAVDGHDGLVLDTTGAAHLLGGEDALIADMQTRLQALGLTVCIAMAPNRGAAWALARHGKVPARICQTGLERALQPLPVRALRLDEETVLLLRRLGLKTIGHLSKIPRNSLMRRFRDAKITGDPVKRLNQAFGQLKEPIECLSPPARFYACKRMAEPIEDPTPHLPEIARHFTQSMEKQAHGARNYVLLAFRTDGTVGEIRASTAAPSRDPHHLVWLIRDRVLALNPRFGFDAIAFLAIETEPMPAHQPSLARQIDPQREFVPLIDRLSARLSAARVAQPLFLESHIPERAEVWASAITNSVEENSLRTGPVRSRPTHVSDTPVSPMISRPARVFDPPEEVHVLYALPEGPPMRFTWRRRQWRITRFDGPERISPEWWRAPQSERLRDYYVVEVEDGERYWIYRQGLAHDGFSFTPRWFVQGVFA